MNVSFGLSVIEHCEEQNLADYNKSSRTYMVADLNQYAANGRGRGETKDDCLPTLTTGSGRLYSQARVGLIII